jgi:RimJ/RimL family protein N-acetyltransferase
MPRHDDAVPPPDPGSQAESFVAAILETPRLLLRPLLPVDLERVSRMLGDAEVMRFYPHVFSPTEAERWLTEQLGVSAGEQGVWLVFEKATAEAVAQVSLIEQDVDGAPELEIGYLVASAHWRRGIATESAAALRDHAFRAGRSRLVSLIRPENVASHGVARKIGMRPERATTFAGLPHILFAIDRSSWQTLASSDPISVR